MGRDTRNDKDLRVVVVLHKDKKQLLLGFVTWHLGYECSCRIMRASSIAAASSSNCGDWMDWNVAPLWLRKVAMEVNACAVQIGNPVKKGKAAEALRTLERRVLRAEVRAKRQFVRGGPHDTLIKEQEAWLFPLQFLLDFSLRVNDPSKVL